MEEIVKRRDVQEAVMMDNDRKRVKRYRYVVKEDIRYSKV